MKFPSESRSGELVTLTCCFNRWWWPQSIRYSLTVSRFSSVCCKTSEQERLHSPGQAENGLPSIRDGARPQIGSVFILASITFISESTVMMASFTLRKIASRRLRCAASSFSFCLRSVTSRLTV